ncbi:hypothetical protein GC209_14365 [bacterium]|nr:hypothetical protein [bacterium]
MTTNNPASGKDKGLPAYLRNPTPHDHLMTAISILQLKSLAEDSCSDGKGAWGLQFLESSALDHAIHLLIGIMEDVESLPAHEVTE